MPLNIFAAGHLDMLHMDIVACHLLGWAVTTVIMTAEQPWRDPHHQSFESSF